jgi:hypothetical protein
MTALTDAARRTIAEHEKLVLSARDRVVFFDTLVNPPAASERLRCARRSSANVWGGIGSPSGVRKCPRQLAAGESLSVQKSGLSAFGTSESLLL